MNTQERIIKQDTTIYNLIMNEIEVMKTANDKKGRSIDDITKAVNDSINMDFPQLRVLVSRFLYATEEDGIGFVSPGRSGGYRLGVRPAKKVRKTKVETAETTTEETN